MKFAEKLACYLLCNKQKLSNTKSYSCRRLEEIKTGLNASKNRNPESKDCLKDGA